MLRDPESARQIEGTLDSAITLGKRCLRGRQWTLSTVDRRKAQGNRVSYSGCDEAGKEVVVPGSDLALQAG